MSLVSAMERVQQLFPQAATPTATSSATASATPSASTAFSSALSTALGSTTSATSQGSGGLGSSAGGFTDQINSAAAQYGVDPKLVSAVISQESSFNPSATSSAGAQGLMQLMPSTSQELGVTNPYDATQSIDGGTKLLKSLLDRFGGNTTLAVAAYNAGSGAVDKFGGVPPYPETQNYVTSVLSKMNAS